MDGEKLIWIKIFSLLFLLLGTLLILSSGTYAWYSSKKDHPSEMMTKIKQEEPTEVQNDKEELQIQSINSLENKEPVALIEEKINFEIQEPHWILNEGFKTGLRKDKDPQVKNTGNSGILLRIKIKEQWLFKEDSEIKELLDKNYVSYSQDFIETIDKNGNTTWNNLNEISNVDLGSGYWVKGSEENENGNYYYYSNPLKPNETTIPLFKSIQINKEKIINENSTEFLNNSFLNLVISVEVLSNTSHTELIGELWGEDLPDSSLLKGWN